MRWPQNYEIAKLPKSVFETLWNNHVGWSKKKKIIIITSTFSPLISSSKFYQMTQINSIPYKRSYNNRYFWLELDLTTSAIQV